MTLTVNEIILIGLGLIFIIFIFAMAVMFAIILGARLAEWFADWIEYVFSNF